MQSFVKVNDIDVLIDPRPYKIFRVLLSQSDNNDPEIMATVESNTGSDLSFVRDSAGQYSAPLPINRDHFNVTASIGNSRIDTDYTNVELKSWVESGNIIIQSKNKDTDMLQDGGIKFADLSVIFLDIPLVSQQ